MVKRHFHELIIKPIDIDPNKSVLLLANHFSYWDGTDIIFVDAINY